MFNPGQEISSLDFGAIIGGSLNAVVEAQAQSSRTSVDFIKSVGFMPGKSDENGKVIGVGDPIMVSFKYTKEVSPYMPGKTEVTGVKVNSPGSGYADAYITGLKIGNTTLEPGDYTITFGENGEIETVSILKDVAENSGTAIDVLTDATLIPNGVTPTGAALVLTKKTAEGRPPVFQDMNLSVPILTMLPIPFIRVEHADIDFNVKINSVTNTETNDSSTNNVTNKTDAGYKGFGAHVNTSLNASFSNQKSSSSSENVKKDYSLNIKVHAIQDDMPAGMSRILDILESNIVTRPVSAMPPPAPAQATA